MMEDFTKRGVAQTASLFLSFFYQVIMLIYWHHSKITTIEKSSGTKKALSACLISLDRMSEGPIEALSSC